MAPLMSARDEPGKLREYETIVILRPDLADEGIANINKKVQGVIEKYDGRVLNIENWGRRRLAYRISSEQLGNYYYWRYLATAEVPGELKRMLRVLDTVLREFTIKLDENVDPDARPADVDPVVLDPTQRLHVEEDGADAGDKEAGRAEGDEGGGQAGKDRIDDSDDDESNYRDDDDVSGRDNSADDMDGVEKDEADDDDAGKKGE